MWPDRSCPATEARQAIKEAAAANDGMVPGCRGEITEKDALALAGQGTSRWVTSPNEIDLQVRVENVLYAFAIPRPERSR